MTRYCIDTSSIIAAGLERYPRSNFPALWDRLEGLIAASRLVAPDLVLDELAVKDDVLHDWAKAQEGFIQPATPDIQDEVMRVLAAHPKLVQESRRTTSADAWVIGMARERGLTVVTEEFERKKGGKVGIPVVCRDLGVPFVRLVDLIRGEHWRF